jgi:hypothetical protein
MSQCMEMGDSPPSGQKGPDLPAITRITQAHARHHTRSELGRDCQRVVDARCVAGGPSDWAWARGVRAPQRSSPQEKNGISCILCFPD